MASLLLSMINAPAGPAVKLDTLPAGATVFYNKDYWLVTGRLYDAHTRYLVRLSARDGQIGDDAALGFGTDVVPVPLQLILG